MKKFLKNNSFLIGVFIFALFNYFAYLCITNDYMTPKNYEATLIHKNIIHSKSGCYAHVYKIENQTFDECVNASFYVESKIGTTYNISRRPFDIKQTAIENALYFFSPAIVVSILIVLWLFVLYFILKCVFIYIVKWWNKND